MIEFLQAGGWLMIPILLSSILAMAIIMERSLSLRTIRILPARDIQQARKLAKIENPPRKVITTLSQRSLLGHVLATVLESHHLPRHVIKENVEEVGRHAVHEMERYMTDFRHDCGHYPFNGFIGDGIGDDSSICGDY